MLHTWVQLALPFWRLKIKHVDEKGDGKDLMGQMSDVPRFKDHGAAVDKKVSQLWLLEENANAFASQTKTIPDLPARAPL